MHPDPPQHTAEATEHVTLMDASTLVTNPGAQQRERAPLPIVTPPADRAAATTAALLVGAALLGTLALAALLVS
jgi:hypothetical protein